ncbi:MAG: MFS transporter [bacterium]
MKTKKTYLSRNVIMTSFSSFFTDVSSEMIYPLIQAFVRSMTVSVGPVLGIMEGVVESLASLLKVFSGYFSDKTGNRKFLTVFGYSLSSFAKVLFFVPNIFALFFVRFFDRVGKGIRTAPRDALISESVPKEFLGKAFGFQRGWDFAGSFFGVLLLYIIISKYLPGLNNVINGKGSVSPKEFYPIFFIVVLSAFIAVIFLLFTKDKKVNDAAVDSKPILRPSLNIKNYDKNLKIFFLSQLIFTLGNSSNQFLLLQSTNITGLLSTVLLMYLLFNLTTFCFSTLFGSLSDKYGRKKFLVTGYIIYAIVYTAFGFISSSHSFLLWFFWPLYGLFYAMTDGVEKAFVSEVAPSGSKATALGFHSTIVGIGLLPASLIAGFLFVVNSRFPFIFGGLMALSAAVIIALFVKIKKD